MKKFLKFIKNNWITAWLIVASLILIGGVAFARYNDGQNIVKRVIATDVESGLRFSSNYLATGNSNLQLRSVATTWTGNIEYELYIYNYCITNPAGHYSTDLDYKLTPTFMTKDGSRALTQSEIQTLIGSDSVVLKGITLNDQNEQVETQILSLNKDNYNSFRNGVSQTLNWVSNKGSENCYILSLPESMIGENISFQLIATPDNKHRDISDIVLSSRFAATYQTAQLVMGWQGNFDDDVNIPLSQYEGFNYCITGSGEATGTITWNPALVEPNVFEIKALFGDSIDIRNVTANPTTGMKSITVSLSSDDNGGRYDFQLYIKDANAKTQIAGMDWATFKDTVCVFTEN